MINIYKNVLSALKNKTLRANLKKATATAIFKRNEAVALSETFENSRMAAIASRDASIPRLKELLETFCGRCADNGIKVFVCDNYENANIKITSLIKERGANFIVKSKSMMTEELGLNRHLENNGIKPVETDLGEFIVALAGETPSHLTAPALHKSRREIAKLFHEKLEMPYSEDVHELSFFARRYLREKFMTAKIGLSGANFAAADSGSITVVENEANARLAINLPETHIAVFGVEKLIEKFTDLPYFLDILSKSATGQLLNAYTTIAGPPAPGKERIFVIITTKRFEIAADPVFKESLRCIRCGACQNICPVFQRISGHGYEFTYAGPIGMILAPLFTGYEKCSELIDASTLCGFCKSVCPVKIDLPGLILEHRIRYNARKDIAKTIFKQIKQFFSYIHSIIMSNYFLSSFAAPAGRFYFAISQKILSRNYIPLWSSFSKRDFIGLAPRSFMESYFTRSRHIFKKQKVNRPNSKKINSKKKGGCND